MRLNISMRHRLYGHESLNTYTSTRKWDRSELGAKASTSILSSLPVGLPSNELKSSRRFVSWESVIVLRRTAIHQTLRFAASCTFVFRASPAHFGNAGLTRVRVHTHMGIFRTGSIVTGKRICHAWESPHACCCYSACRHSDVVYASFASERTTLSVAKCTEFNAITHIVACTFALVYRQKRRGSSTYRFTASKLQ